MRSMQSLADRAARAIATTLGENCGFSTARYRRWFGGFSIVGIQW